MKWMGRGARDLSHSIQKATCYNYNPEPSWQEVSRALAGWLAGALLVVAVLFTGLPATARVIEEDLVPMAGADLAGSPAGLSITVTTPFTVHVPFVPKSHVSVDGPFGVQLFEVNSGVRDRMAEIGTRWARLALNWRSIEPQNTTPDGYAWSAGFEEQLARLAAQQVKVILYLEGNPTWAATYSNGPIDLVDAGELTEFMQAAVARYSRWPYNVRYWELYNEPDNGSELLAESGSGYFGHTPQAYYDILVAVYEPVKAVDANAVILFGGLAYDLWEDEGGPFVEDFVDEVLDLGGGDHFDAMNFHYYPPFRPKWEPYGHDVLGKRAYLLDKMADYNLDKPIYCTEAGWFSSEPAGGSDEAQSRFVVQLYARSLSVAMEASIWFALVDDDYVGDRQWGLVNADLTPKPAYFAYQTMAEQLRFSTYVRELTDVETGSPAVEAYEFRVKGDGHRLVVAWSDGELTNLVEFSGLWVTVMDKYGSESIVCDEDDGTFDLRVHVPVGPSPIYLHFPAGSSDHGGSLAPALARELDRPC